ncbi:hypothetical protein EML15_00450 [Corynebacterium sp. sy017]|uniref:hypothetical protein n=1 Tax=unclassified Corynebacterium TaxID=2624378 RepID=UPI001186CAE4|nr:MULTISPECIES: hypothetical protein [unclassified Corynebacterium]MBP3087625.1 hypothetical protein [Corynebacterium sp. sy017]TSD92191.1 hypothetical protein ELY17_00450 [Corynebacterium sp. SY003]
MKTPKEEQRIELSWQMRIAGAFMAMGCVLALFFVLDVLQHGWAWDEPFAVTIRVVLIVVASGLFGAFATVSKYQEGRKSQVIALSLAITLIAAGRLIDNTVLFPLEILWFMSITFGFILCGLIIRSRM